MFGLLIWLTFSGDPCGLGKCGVRLAASGCESANSTRVGKRNVLRVILADEAAGLNFVAALGLWGMGSLEGETELVKSFLPRKNPGGRRKADDICNHRPFLLITQCHSQQDERLIDKVCEEADTRIRTADLLFTKTQQQQSVFPKTRSGFSAARRHLKNGLLTVLWGHHTTKRTGIASYFATKTASVLAEAQKTNSRAEKRPCCSFSNAMPCVQRRYANRVLLPRPQAIAVIAGDCGLVVTVEGVAVSLEAIFAPCQESTERLRQTHQQKGNERFP